MNRIDVRTINLNLLPALEALVVEGSVGAAARRTHVTQSAMSHSLARLRALFDDPLLVLSGRRMTRTPLAERLVLELPAALDRLAGAIAAPAPFVPATARRTFRLTTFDYFELTALPDLLAYLARHAPGIDLEIERFSPSQLPALVAGELDLALIGEAPIPLTGLRRQAVLAEPFAVIVRPDHPRVRRALTLDAYLAEGHVLISVEGRRDGAVDRALARLGRARRVAVRVPHFLSAPLAVMRSDHVCTLARSVALRAHALFGARVLPPPLELAPAGVVALWSRRTDADDGARWFRELVCGRAYLAPPASPRARRPRAAARRPRLG